MKKKVKKENRPRKAQNMKKAFGNERSKRAEGGEDEEKKKGPTSKKKKKKKKN